MSSVSVGVPLQAQVATDRCPWCGTSISKAKFLEIERKIAERERSKLAEERGRMQQELRAELQKAAAHEKAEGEKRLAAVVAKVREMEGREGAIRKEVEQQTSVRLKAEAEKKLVALETERDLAGKKLKELEAAKKKDLDQQRTALEKDRDAQLLKVQVQNNRERAQFQQKIDALTRQIQRKTSDELGEGAEIDIYEALRDAFQGDGISRIKRGQPGADIRHEVLHKGVSCGTILIDSKNRQGWQHGYVTKLREDQMAAKAEYAVLATMVFPSGRKELYVDGETRVIVVNRARTVELVGLLRRLMIQMHARGLSQADRTEKRELIYKYVTSEEFRQLLLEASRLTKEMQDVDVEEKRAHDKVWEKRGKMSARLRNVLREVETEVSAILEGRQG
jgi:hypothetical protein